ncbi:hypothetical protein FNF29_07110 [Cafeteria roenbergensis]|uniref:EF-hand domain-containing protein n=1 Tax=Cafeteria roenbergensis TaxID=33653 RepID=A0A5A8C4L8_CAFRO|nr:hypothetical protein FNF29_07110 [Cafeteria roenbergensis]|eukprot:KAA0147765.1 hypothetical protein FNF29_07110 [Cafeteria roenbergensis]
MNWATAAKQLSKKLNQQDIERYRALFRALDTSNDGEIQVEVLELRLTSMGLVTAREELGDLLHDIDVNGNGVIDFEEFVVLMQTLTATVGDVEAAQRDLSGSCLRGRVGERMNWRELIWSILEDPGMSRCARFTGVWMSLAITISTISLVMETMPNLDSWKDAFHVIEVMVTVVFTLEILLRVVTCPSPGAFCSFMNVVDILAVLPLYLEAVMHSEDASGATNAVNILRTLRVLRILKIARYFSSIKLITNALSMSTTPLLMALFLALLGNLLFASGIYYIERGEWSQEQMLYLKANGRPSEFQSIIDGLWWSMITVATVGYGDTVPSSGLGKTLGVVVAFSGVVILAFPISIFAANFSDLYRFTRRRAALRKELSGDVVAGLHNQSVTAMPGGTGDALPRFRNPHLPPANPACQLGSVAQGTARSHASKANSDTLSDARVVSLADGNHALSMEPEETPAAAAGAPKGVDMRSMDVATTSNGDEGSKAGGDDGAFQVPRLKPRHRGSAAGKGVTPTVYDPALTPGEWAMAALPDDGEAQTLAEAIAEARAARRSIIVETNVEDAAILRAKSFAHCDLTDKKVLAAAAADLARDARKRIWAKVRKREQQMRDAVKIELTRRWRSWFEMDASAAIKATKTAVSDGHWLNREVSVLKLSELVQARSVARMESPQPSSRASDRREGDISALQHPAGGLSPLRGTPGVAARPRGFERPPTISAGSDEEGEDDDEHESPAAVRPGRPAFPRGSRSSSPSTAGDDASTDSRRMRHDLVYRKHTVHRLVRKGEDGENVEVTTEVVEERRRRRRRRRRKDSDASP